MKFFSVNRLQKIIKNNQKIISLDKVISMYIFIFGNKKAKKIEKN